MKQSHMEEYAIPFEFWQVTCRTQTKEKANVAINSATVRVVDPKTGVSKLSPAGPVSY